MRKLLRGLAALGAAAVLSLSAVSCSSSGGSEAASAAPVDVTYKCACGVEKSGKTGAAVPQCCGRPMVVKK